MVNVCFKHWQESREIVNVKTIQLDILPREGDKVRIIDDNISDNLMESLPTGLWSNLWIVEDVIHEVLDKGVQVAILYMRNNFEEK